MSDDTYVRRHLRVGWFGLLVFVALGGVLEVLHAVKEPAFLNAGFETRRLLLRLAHAHGTLFSLVNVAYALTAKQRPEIATRGVSLGLLAALVLVPLGFLAGGLTAHGGDPGLPVLLVPPGAAALVVSLAVVARRL